MNAARWVRRLAFAGAASLAVWSVLPTTGVQAAPTPPQTYSAIAGASGVEYNFDRTPGVSPIGNLVHGATPYAAATLAAGTSEAEATAVYIGAFQTLPELLCSQLPAQCTPPPYPLDASAKYPDPQSADATASSHNRTIGGGGAALTAKIDTIHAEAREFSTLADTSVASSALLGGLITTGSTRAMTAQTIDKYGAVVSTAESLVSDITIVKLLHIESVHSTVTAVYDGVHKPKVSAVTTISGVSAAGLAATIDQDGVHVAGSTNKQILEILNKQLNFLLNANYITITAVGASNTPGDHSVHPQAGGVLLSYDNTISGLPKPPTLPAEIPYCSKILYNLRQSQLGVVFDPILAGVPVNFCSPMTPPNPNGHYFGTVTIASAGTLVSAANFSFDGGDGGGLDGGIIPGTGPTTTFVPGTQGTSGTPGTPGIPGTPGTSIDQNPPPQLAGGNSIGYVESLGDAAKRLKYLFPAFMLAVIGVLAGRIGRAPARLPRGST